MLYIIGGSLIVWGIIHSYLILVTTRKAYKGYNKHTH